MARDKIILISTHILEEVHAVCQRAVIIARGKVLADAPPAELESRSRYHGAVSLTTANTVSVKEGLARIEGVASVEIDPQDGRITAFPRAGQLIWERINGFIQDQQITVSEMQLERGRLDEVFRQITTTQEMRA